MCVSSASIVKVMFFAAGPGLYLDFDLPGSRMLIARAGRTAPGERHKQERDHRNAIDLDFHEYPPSEGSCWCDRNRLAQAKSPGDSAFAHHVDRNAPPVPQSEPGRGRRMIDVGECKTERASINYLRSWCE
jgi:hypothetical protein